MRASGFLQILAWFESTGMSRALMHRGCCPTKRTPVCCGAACRPAMNGNDAIRFGAFEYLNKKQLEIRRLNKKLRNLRSLIAKAQRGDKLDEQERRKLAISSEKHILCSLEALKTEDELLEDAFRVARAFPPLGPQPAPEATQARWQGGREADREGVGSGANAEDDQVCEGE